MSPAFEYLLKVSVSLAVVSMLYWFVLSRFTFYTWNRWYLLFASQACLLVPLIDINPALPQTGRLSAVRQLPSMQELYAGPEVSSRSRQVVETGFDPETGIWMVLGAGMAVMLVRFAFQWYSLMRIRRAAALVSDDDVQIYHVAKDIVPFSFGKAIFYNPDAHTETELKDIILHEYIHVRERHTADVIWGELLCMLNWYNPFAWLIRWSIRQNLEYIADRAVLGKDADRQNYQYLLLKVAGYSGFRIGNAFSVSSLKRRIIMMNKRRTPRILLISFLLVVPVALVLLLIFRKQDRAETGLHTLWEEIRKEQNEMLNKNPQDLIISGLILDARTGQPIPAVQLEIAYKQKPFKTIRSDVNGFYFLAIPPIPDDKTPETGRYFNVFPESFTISNVSATHREFSYGESRLNDLEGHPEFKIIFLPRTDEYNAPVQFYGINKKNFVADWKTSSAQKQLYDALRTASGPFLKEQQLIVSFKDRYPRPSNVITKYRNGYFDRKRNLMGYEGALDFYLDGKKVDYTKVNDAFAGSPYMLKETQEYRNMTESGTYDKKFYLTFDLYKPAPPQVLMAGNIEVLDPQRFDTDILKEQAYLLDGFRQTYGVGSNLMPAKQEIVKVMRFKGRLARYYDRKLDEIWWIETRPAAEVFERPDFAFSSNQENN